MKLKWKIFSSAARKLCKSNILKWYIFLIIKNRQFKTVDFLHIFKFCGKYISNLKELIKMFDKICLILVMLMLVVFERIFGVLCSAVPFLSANISVFCQKVLINQLFVCMYFLCRFSEPIVWIMQVVWSHALRNDLNTWLTRFLSI